MDAKLLRPYWSDIEEAPHFVIDAPHQKIIQATNRTYAKTSLLRDQDRDGRPKPSDCKGYGPSFCGKRAMSWEKRLS